MFRYLWVTLTAALLSLQTSCEQRIKPSGDLEELKAASLEKDTETEHSPSRAFQLGEADKQEEANVTAGPKFRDVASLVGLSHTYLPGDPELLLMVQPTGGGVGWGDFDRDGCWDLYLNQAGDPSASRSSKQPTDRLFLNLGNQQFRDISAAARIDERDYSQGVAIGDFDNDGFDDVFVSNVGADTLFHNQGDGTFVDVSQEALEQPSAWSSSAAWGDVDGDGDLDLYVCRYVAFDRFHPQQCRNVKNQPKMCQPNEVEPIPDELYLNEGNGEFRPAAQERGLVGPGNRSLGVAIADFNNDGRPDI